MARNLYAKKSRSALAIEAGRFLASWLLRQRMPSGQQSSSSLITLSLDLSPRPVTPSPALSRLSTSPAPSELSPSPAPSRLSPSSTASRLSPSPASCHRLQLQVGCHHLQLQHQATTIIVHWSKLNHYEAAVPVPGCIPGSTLPATTPKADGFCSCGVNRKGSSAKSCCQSPVYSTRCKCFKMSRSCTSQCRCINCDNSYGKRPLNPEQTSRKRRSHQWQGELPTQKRFARKHKSRFTGTEYGQILRPSYCRRFTMYKILRIYQQFSTTLCYSKSCTCSEPLPENEKRAKLRLLQNWAT